MSSFHGSYLLSNPNSNQLSRDTCPSQNPKSGAEKPLSKQGRDQPVLDMLLCCQRCFKNVTRLCPIHPPLLQSSQATKGPGSLRRAQRMLRFHQQQCAAAAARGAPRFALGQGGEHEGGCSWREEDYCSYGCIIPH